MLLWGEKDRTLLTELLCKTTSLSAEMQIHNQQFLLIHTRVAGYWSDPIQLPLRGPWAHLELQVPAWHIVYTCGLTDWQTVGRRQHSNWDQPDSKVPLFLGFNASRVTTQSKQYRPVSHATLHVGHSALSDNLWLSTAEAGALKYVILCHPQTVFLFKKK